MSAEVVTGVRLRDRSLSQEPDLAESIGVFSVASVALPSPILVVRIFSGLKLRGSVMVIILEIKV